MVNCVIILVIKCLCFVESQFLVPTEQSPIQEIFAYDEYYEYVFSNEALEWNLAADICGYEYNGVLATLETDELKEFAVEAMSESNMLLDGLWLGLQKTNGLFTWSDMNITVPNSEFTKCGNNSKVSHNCTFGCTNEMNCGALVRANHTEICLINLSCEASRGFICKRPTGDPSTHQGWIKIRERLYKIFYKRLNYYEACKACIHYDKEARLAVVERYKDVQLLGRYLLIGRPSLERVWIGARWEEDFMQYSFEWEPIVLANKTNLSGYPPWRRKAMSKPLGCLLLDRHLSNITYFVESACDRLHYYMCYKIIEDDPVDICKIGDYDWRVYYNKKDWFQASDVCKESAPSGRLPVLERKDMKYFIHIMESSRRYLLHVWLGAYFREGVWTWTYTNHALPKVEENGYPPWIVNRTYEEEVERFNLCLNIDRENALKPLFYGIRCNYAQTIICQYDQGTLCNGHNGSTTTSTATTSGMTTPITVTPSTKSTKTTSELTTPNPTTKTTSTVTTVTTTIKTTTTPRPTTTEVTTRTMPTSTTPITTATSTPRTTTTTRTTTTRETTTIRPTTTKSTTSTTPKTTESTRPTETKPTTATSTSMPTSTASMTKATTETTVADFTTEGPIRFSTTTEWPEWDESMLVSSTAESDINISSP